MEEDNSSNPAQISAKTTGQRKHAAMLERLSVRSTSRKPESDSSSSFESTTSFLTRFSNSKDSIESELARCRLVTDPDSKSHLKSDLDKVSASIAELERLVAENSYFLPSYEVRSSLKTISELKQTLEDLNSELLPKKKFAFRNKNAKKEQVTLPKDAEAVKSDFKKVGVTVRESPGIRNRENAVLVRNFKCSGSDVGEFTLSDLNGCEVRLIGSLRALFIHRLRNCRVYVGPVFGSILIEEVEGCVFVLASHQIRVHHAKGTDFFLRVRSRPIIEDSSGVRFAPYCLSYEGIEQDLQDSSLEEETGNWANVDDFKWLRAVHSPNWSILPENERIDAVNISNLETGMEDC
ncbi:tubulin-folding cofactor C [Malania oleifera]|uniref:tubulin-folding cofactor C n=1 Tax=Malania oleifera TaxID=397392 RepID=UPI0025AECD8A|nr:tubulin-folding cofactor C [Malania oleifera]